MRDFAAKQNTDTFLAASENPPRNGEGDQPEPLAEAGGGVGTAPELTAADAEAAMAQMSEKFREGGGEIYLPAGE